MDQELVDMPKFDLEALLSEEEKTLDWEPVLQAQDKKLELEAMVLVVNQLLETAVHQVQETMVIETQNTSVNPLLSYPALVALLPPPPPLQMQSPFRYDSYEEYLQAREQEQANPPSPKRLRVDKRFDEFWREFV